MRGLSPKGKDRLLMAIVTCDEYEFDPIELYQIYENNYCFYDTAMEEERGFKSTVKEGDSNIRNVYGLGRVEDEYIMLALSKLLLNKVHRGEMEPLHLTKLRDLMEDHYEYIGKLDCVRILVKIELDDSFYLAQMKTEILKHIDGILDDGFIKELITQLVTLPIRRIDGGKIIENSGLSRVGELTRVILDLYYRKVFDPVLEETYPGIRYSRWYNEVFIAIDMKKNNRILSIGHIKREIVDNLLEKNQLRARAVEGLHHLGHTSRLACHNMERVVSLQEDGSVHVCGINDQNEWTYYEVPP